MPIYKLEPIQIDVHCHLSESVFDSDRGAVLDRAREKGIVQFWSDSCQESDWKKVERLFDQYGPEVIRPGFGIHPWFAASATDGWETRLEKQLRRIDQSVVAEIGLDKLRVGQLPWSVQIPVFEKQLTLAIRLNRPVTIHCVRCWDFLLPILKKVQPTIPLLFHAYGGSVELAGNLARQYDCRFSFGSALLRSDNRKVHAVYKFLEQKFPDRIRYESDAPFIPLIKGTRNEPAFGGVNAKPEPPSPLTSE